MLLTPNVKYNIAYQIGKSIKVAEFTFQGFSESNKTAIFLRKKAIVGIRTLFQRGDAIKVSFDAKPKLRADDKVLSLSTETIGIPLGLIQFAEKA